MTLETHRKIFCFISENRIQHRINFANYSTHTLSTAYRKTSLPFTTLSTRMKLWMHLMRCLRHGGMSWKSTTWLRQRRKFNQRFGSSWRQKWITFMHCRLSLMWVEQSCIIVNRLIYIRFSKCTAKYISCVVYSWVYQWRRNTFSIRKSPHSPTHTRAWCVRNLRNKQISITFHILLPLQ